MKARLVLMFLFLMILGVLFYSVNQSSGLSDYEKALFIVSVFALTLSCFSLAMSSLKSISLLLVFRTVAFALMPYFIVDASDLKFTMSLLLTSMLFLSFYSQKLLALITKDAGIENEDVFILKTPFSITLFYSCVWIVFWLTTIEALRLLLTEQWLIGTAASVLAILIPIIFLPSQMRTLLRRSIIVPYGIVLSDSISLTDVVLFPLAKIKNVSFVENFDESDDTSFCTEYKKGKLVFLELTQETDSLIIRNNVNETTRKSVSKIYINVVNAQDFVDTFYRRFHKTSPEPITASEEKMIEKKLGIETAPRSDAKLPKWRNKK